jgi:hypothetical protein
MSIAVGPKQRRIAWPLPARLRMTGTNRECRKQWLRSVEEKELVSSASIFENKTSEKHQISGPSGPRDPS